MQIVPAEIPLDPPKIALVGEAPGAEEDKYGRPFCGLAGRELDQMLHEAGIARSECLVTNVVNTRPLGNRFGEFCCKRDLIPKGSPAPFCHPIKAGEYLKPEYWPHLDRLHYELTTLSQPNVVVALGNVALWALAHIQPKISAYRGTCLLSPWGFKLLPTYHPANVLRAYENRVVVVSDLIKAKHQAEFAEIKRPRRWIYIAPDSVREVEDFIYEYIYPAREVAVDIENPKGAITCVGLAPSPSIGISIPFVHPAREDQSYWSKEDEVRVWQLIRSALAQTRTTYIFQNGLYDMYHLWRQARVYPRGNIGDTMVRHHALYPEMPKDLGFLGAAYTDEGPWKQERPKGMATEKEES